MGCYPVTLSIEGRLVVVIGAAPPAAEKVEDLLATGAQVRLVARDPGERLLRHAGAGAIQLRNRRYAPGDLGGAWLAITIPGEEEADDLAAIAREAEARRIFLNVVDRPALCSFAAP